MTTTIYSIYVNEWVIIKSRSLKMGYKGAKGSMEKFRNKTKKKHI